MAAEFLSRSQLAETAKLVEEMVSPNRRDNSINERL